MITTADILKADILIVDDQEANVTFMSILLRGAGYVSITTTRNPREVCELHRKNRYALILLDLVMPGLNGFQVMEGLRETEAHGYLPVLVVTAQPEHKLRALKAGARDFISKPFDLAEVLMRVQNVIEMRLMNQRDETRRKQAEQDALAISASAISLRLLNSELEQRVKDRTVQLENANRELEAFSYSCSHDLRAPLRHVLSYVDLLTEDSEGTLSKASQGHLLVISQATKRMGKLIDDLLNFARLGQGELLKVEVNLDELARDAGSDFARETKERGIVWDFGPLPLVHGDRALLRMVFVNLLANAVKFTSGRAAAKIEIRSSACAEGVAVHVGDNGVGFDPQHAGKLFGVFQRLHGQEEFAGTGIGLANVQRIVQRHGGQTWADGVVNGGATFHFSIGRKNGAQAGEPNGLLLGGA